MTLLFLCQINVVPEIQGTVNVEAASRKTKKNAMNAYKKMLLKNVKWSNGYYARSKELYFTCIDINKDGVKELILTIWILHMRMDGIVFIHIQTAALTHWDNLPLYQFVQTKSILRILI